MTNKPQPIKATGKAKAFLEELQAFADAQRALIEAEVSGFPTDAVARDLRRTRVQSDFEFFARTYFPHYVKSEPSMFHAWFFDTVPKLIDQPGGVFINFSAPRGEAKSTLGTQLFNIWCVVTERKHFMPIVMDAFDQAATMLEAIKAELEDNPRLDVRLIDTPRQPHLVVIDSRLETPLNAHLFIPGRSIFIYAAERNDAKKLFTNYLTYI